jgi:serine/threonine protein kinase
MMMEESPVVPKGSHFTDEVTHHGRPGIFWWKERCSVKDVQYYYIDFGLSRYYPEGNETATALGYLRGFEEIPELSNTIPYDPFKVDIYQLGRTILNVIKVIHKLRFHLDLPFTTFLAVSGAVAIQGTR